MEANPESKTLAVETGLQIQLLRLKQQSRLTEASGLQNARPDDPDYTSTSRAMLLTFIMKGQGRDWALVASR